MAISESSIGRIRRYASQYSATHGRAPSPWQISAMLQAEIEADLARQQQGRALALQERSININESLGQQRLGLMERELTNQEKAAKVSGYGTAAMLGLVGAKELGLTQPIGEAVKKGVGSMWSALKPAQAIPTAGTAVGGTMAGTAADATLGWTFAGAAGETVKPIFGGILDDIGAEWTSEFASFF